MVARHTTVLNQVETVIEGLVLTGISTANIVQMLVPADDPKYLPALPAVVISPFGTENFLTVGTNRNEYLGYPVTVAIVAAANQDQATDIDTYLQWRETIYDAFHFKKLSANAQNIDCRVEFGAIIERAAWGANLLVSSFTIRVNQLVTRT